MYNLLKLDLIRQDHIDIVTQIELADGEVTPEIERALQLNEQELQQQAISIGHLITTLEYQAETIDKEMARLDKLLDRCGKVRDMLKDRLSQAMKQYGVEKIESPTLKIFFRNSVAVNVTDPKLVPDEYKKFMPIVLKQEIKAALQEGKEVPGAELDYRKNLQIK